MNAELRTQTNVSATSYSAAAPQAVQSALVRCTDALAHSPTFDLESAQLQETQEEMIFIKCRSDKAFEEVREEIVPLWQAEVAGQEVSLHVVDNTTHGLDFKFAILFEDSTFLTGRILVETAAI